MDAVSHSGICPLRCDLRAVGLLEEPPKWRVGVCLISRPRRKVKTRAVEGSANVKTDGHTTASSSAQGATLGGKTEPDPHAGGTGRGEQESDTRGTKEPGESYTDAKLVGELRFHVSPVVTPTTDDNTQDEPESIQIRHFIDAGWMYTRDIRVYHYMLSKL